jgi:hypothetical protein
MRTAWRRLAVAALLGLAAGACGAGSGWEGRYEGPKPDGSGGRAVLLLQPEGKGQWTAEQENTLLRWEERSGALWLHLKTGGVLVARPVAAEKAFIIEIPGVGTCRLKRAGP